MGRSTLRVRMIWRKSVDTLFKIIIVAGFFSTLILFAYWAQAKLDEYWGDHDTDE